MNPRTVKAFYDELEKIAFDMNAANRVLSVTKKLQLPKAAVQVLPEQMRAAPLAGLASPKATRQSFQRVRQMFGRVGMQPEQLEASMAASEQLSAPIQRVSNKLGRGSIVQGKGGPTQFLSPRHLDRMSGGMLQVPAVPGNQQKMLNAIYKGHELDELQVPQHSGMIPFGHRSPDVLLREHNRIATLPQEYGAVKAHAQALRGPGEARLMKEVGVDYGNGPRLSRHARKHLTNLMNRKSEDELNQMLHKEW